MKSDPLLRLLMRDLVGEAVTRESLATLRDDIEDIRLRIDAAEESAHRLPHREKYLLLLTGFLRRLLQLHLALVDEVERELAPTDRGRRGKPLRDVAVGPQLGESTVTQHRSARLAVEVATGHRLERLVRQLDIRVDTSLSIAP